MTHKIKKGSHGPVGGEATSQRVTVRTPSRQWVWYWVAMTSVGLLGRIILIVATHGSIYPGDHDDFVRWGIQSADDGVLTLYDKAPARHNMQVWPDGRPMLRQREFDRVCNYPPLSAYLLYASDLCSRRSASTG